MVSVNRLVPPSNFLIARIQKIEFGERYYTYAPATVLLDMVSAGEDGTLLHTSEEVLFRSVNVDRPVASIRTMLSRTHPDNLTKYLEKYGFDLAKTTIHDIRHLLLTLPESKFPKTFEELIKRIEDYRISGKYNLDKYIGSIKVSFEKYQGEYKTEEPFDFITVDTSIISDDPLAFAKQHKKAIVDMMLNRISTRKRWTTLGLPIEVLKLTDLILRRDKTLSATFELKRLKEEGE